MKQSKLKSLNEYTFLFEGIINETLQRGIQEVSSVYVDTITSLSGQPFDPERLTKAAVSSVILNMLFGRRFMYEDQRLLDLNNQVTLANEDVSPIVNVIPWIRFVPYYKRRLERFGKNCNILRNLMKEEISKCLSDKSEDCFVKKFAEKEG